MTLGNKEPGLKPLLHRRIVVTRSEAQAGELSARLAQAGAEVLELPLIRVKPNDQATRAGDILTEIGSYEWLVFTSANGVRFFFDRFFQTFQDIRCMGLLRIAVIGEGTAQAVGKYHLQVDLVPPKAEAEALAGALRAEETLDNLKILVVTGSLNADTLVKLLEAERAIVDVLPVYETESADVSDHPAAANFRAHGADAITFASASAVQSFVRQAAVLQLIPGARHPLTCSIGPATSEAMRRSGIPVDVEAKEHSLDGMVAALAEKFSHDK